MSVTIHRRDFEAILLALKWATAPMDLPDEEQKAMEDAVSASDDHFQEIIRHFSPEVSPQPIKVIYIEDED